MPPQIKQAKLETLEAIIKEVEGIRKDHVWVSDHRSRYGGIICKACGGQDAILQWR